MKLKSRQNAKAELINRQRCKVGDPFALPGHAHIIVKQGKPLFFSYHGYNGESGTQQIAGDNKEADKKSEIITKIEEAPDRNKAMKIAMEFRAERPVLSMENPISSSGSIDEEKLLNFIKGSSPVQIREFIDGLDAGQTKKLIGMLPQEKIAKMVMVAIDMGLIDKLIRNAEPSHYEKIFGGLDGTYIEKALSHLTPSQINGRNWVVPNISPKLQLFLLQKAPARTVEAVVIGIRNAKKEG